MYAEEFLRLLAGSHQPFELIDGEVVKIEKPAKCLNNLNNLWLLSRDILEGSYVAPYASRHDSLKNVDTLLLPDFFSIMDFRCYKGRVFRGIPEWVLEIVTESNHRNLEIWAEIRVPHVWLVFEKQNEVLCYTLTDDGYKESRLELTSLYDPRVLVSR